MHNNLRFIRFNRLKNDICEICMNVISSALVELNLFNQRNLWLLLCIIHY